MAPRPAVTKKMALRYKSAGRAEKGRILDELVALTSWHRDYARAALKEAFTIKEVKPKPGRTPVYGPSVISSLVICWTLSQAPAGKRRGLMLQIMVPLWRRDGDLDITDDEAELLTKMSPATIDRILAPERDPTSTIFVQPDKKGAHLQLRLVVDQLHPIAPEAAAKLEAMEHDLLAYAGFPPAHWSKIGRTTPWSG